MFSKLLYDMLLSLRLNIMIRVAIAFSVMSAVMVPLCSVENETLGVGGLVLMTTL